MEKFNVGILGATGTVGCIFVETLQKHPWFNIKCLAASSRSAGKSFYESLECKNVENLNISKEILNFQVFDVKKDAKKIVSEVDFVFCALDMTKEEIQNLEYLYAKLECPVISNNSAHRFTPDVPMVIPEINPEHLRIIKSQRERLKIKKGFIVTKPNCSLQCFVPPLHVLTEYGLDSIIVCTYQAISGAGKTFATMPEIHDNIIPHISGEELKTEKEPLKIWGKLVQGEIICAKLPKISSQCSRVPVSNGHMAAVHVKFKYKPDINDIIYKWKNFNYKKLPSSPEKMFNFHKEETRPQTKLDRDFANGMGISIGRLKKDNVFDYKFVCISHNTIRGAAGGSVLLAELLVSDGYI
ncbi:MAG: aspartate-semialdehyde dehydrogenase [Candidatus Improbicoccus devescovinae]|nr:MAG: aspartate-semialdehyde dehydrogenase [Candidatus Improbicoccus devescovinae]